jgi:hypothetical protein
MSWECDDCKALRIQQFIDLLNHATRQHQFLYIGTVLEKDWDRTYRSLGEYIRIEIGDKRAYLVIATNPFTWAQHQTRHNCRKAAKALIETLHKPKGRDIYRPVSTSRNWQQEKKESTFKRICFATAGKFQEMTDKFGATVKHACGAVYAKVSPENIEKCVCFLTNCAYISKTHTAIRQLIDENERFWAEKLGSKYVPLEKLART